MSIGNYDQVLHCVHRERAIAIGEKIGLHKDRSVLKGSTPPRVPVWVERWRSGRGEGNYYCRHLSKLKSSRSRAGQGADRSQFGSGRIELYHRETNLSVRIT